MTTNSGEVDATDVIDGDGQVGGQGQVGHEPDGQLTHDQHEQRETTGTGLDENVAGALSYLFGVLSGVVFYVVDQDNEFVRFHSAQSIAVFGMVFVASIGLSILGTVLSTLFFTGSASGFIVGSIVSLMLGLVWLVLMVGAFGLWAYLIVRAYQGKTPRIPVAASVADRLV